MQWKIWNRWVSAEFLLFILAFLLPLMRSSDSPRADLTWGLVSKSVVQTQQPMYTTIGLRATSCCRHMLLRDRLLSQRQCRAGNHQMTCGTAPRIPDRPQNYLIVAPCTKSFVWSICISCTRHHFRFTHCSQTSTRHWSCLFSTHLLTNRWPLFCAACPLCHPTHRMTSPPPLSWTPLHIQRAYLAFSLRQQAPIYICSLIIITIIFSPVTLRTRMKKCLT